MFVNRYYYGQLHNVGWDSTSLDITLSYRTGNPVLLSQKIRQKCFASKSVSPFIKKRAVETPLRAATGGY